MNFKTSGIEKYDGSTNPTEWLEVYQLAIEAARGDSYIMANYLSACLSSSTTTWLLGLPAGSVHSWNHLRRLFTNNLCAMCTCPGIDWDLASVIQKKGGPSKNSSSSSATTGTSSRRLTTNLSLRSSRMGSGTLP
jgi:hypothetical protein